MDISRFIDYLAKEKRYSPNTIAGYQNDLFAFEDYASVHYDTLIHKCNHRVIRSWFSFLLENGMSPKSIHRKASTLKSYYKYLLRSNAISSSPMDLVPLPKVGKQLPKFVEESSLNFLLNDFEFENSFVGLRDKLVLDLFYQTGIRRAELIGIKVSDVDLHQSTIKVLGKRNKERIIPISSSLVETIKKYLPYRISSEVDSLFLTASGKKLYPKLVYNIVNKYLSQVTTLSKKSPHVLRHSFATHMLNNGAELNTIKEILGHVNLSATQVYTHNSLEKIKSIYKQAHPRA